MNLYWFLDEDGHYWKLYAARSEERAWELFLQETRSFSDEENITLEELQQEYQLGAVTAVSETEGEVATIFPLECNFTIKKSFGSEELGHLINL